MTLKGASGDFEQSPHCAANCLQHVRPSVQGAIVCKSRACFVLFVGCLTSQQHASVSQGRICTDNFTCCHTEIEAADQTFHLTQSQYTDTGPTSPSADPITKSRATLWEFIMSNMSCATRYEGTAHLLSLTELKSRVFQLFFFHRLKPVTDEGRDETGVPGENPDDELQKMSHIKARRFRPQPRLEPAL